MVNPTAVNGLLYLVLVHVSKPIIDFGVGTASLEILINQSRLGGNAFCGDAAWSGRLRLSKIVFYHIDPENYFDKEHFCDLLLTSTKTPTLAPQQFFFRLSGIPTVRHQSVTINNDEPCADQ